MDYPCAKFGYFNFSRFGFIVRTDRHTKSQNHTQRVIMTKHIIITMTLRCCNQSRHLFTHLPHCMITLKVKVRIRVMVQQYGVGSNSVSAF